jgi:hypothetical protein
MKPSPTIAKKINFALTVFLDAIALTTGENKLARFVGFGDRSVNQVMRF